MEIIDKRIRYDDIEKALEMEGHGGNMGIYERYIKTIEDFEDGLSLGGMGNIDYQESGWD